MSEDLRCCGTGTCIINAEGLCWCGQQWDGEKMARPQVQVSIDKLPDPKANLSQDQSDPTASH